MCIHVFNARVNIWIDWYAKNEYAPATPKFNKLLNWYCPDSEGDKGQYQYQHERQALHKEGGDGATTEKEKECGQEGRKRQTSVSSKHQGS